MKISIVLPGYYNFPIGGYHVLYTHANLLRARGHEVSILFPRKLWPGSSWKGRLKTRFWALSTRLRNRPLIPHFPLHDDVRVMLLSDLGGPALPKADVLIATGWATAELLRHAPADRGRKFYFVQDYEYWKTADPVTRERIESTYNAGFKILTISKVVDEMVRQCGGSPVAQVPNGIDFDVFGRDVPGADRRPLTLGFPIRTEPFKGAADAIAALTMLREIHGDRLEVTAFGSSEIAAPDWIRRLDRPDQTRLRAFYNDVAVFLVPSHFEGWGLPGSEAMACGAALVTTDNGGSRDYAIPGETALVVPPEEPRLLAEAVNRLFEDQPLRNALAERGHAFIQRFQWERSADTLERALLAGLDETAPEGLAP